jgi:hypothetical protein
MNVKISVKELKERLKPKIYEANKEQFDKVFLSSGFVHINKNDLIESKSKGDKQC